MHFSMAVGAESNRVFHGVRSTMYKPLDMVCLEIWRPVLSVERRSFLAQITSPLGSTLRMLYYPVTHYSIGHHQCVLRQPSSAAPEQVRSRDAKARHRTRDEEEIGDRQHNKTTYGENGNRHFQHQPIVRRHERDDQQQ